MNLIPIIIWYAVSINNVEVRIRTYFNDTAIKEESCVIDESSLLNNALLRKVNAWDESDIVSVLTPLFPNITWGGNTKPTLQDINPFAAKV